MGTFSHFVTVTLPAFCFTPCACKQTFFWLKVIRLLIRCFYSEFSCLSKILPILTRGSWDLWMPWGCNFSRPHASSCSVRLMFNACTQSAQKRHIQDCSRIIFWVLSLPQIERRCCLDLLRTLSGSGCISILRHWPSILRTCKTRDHIACLLWSTHLCGRASRPLRVLSELPGIQIALMASSKYQLLVR